MSPMTPERAREIARQRMIDNPTYYQEMGKKGKGVKKKSYNLKPGSLTPAERGRLGANKRWVDTITKAE